MNTIKLGFSRLVFLLLSFIFYLLPCSSQTLAPGAPGNDAQWATAGKQAVGTSASLESKVWFTLANGVMTEVYYPDVTVANTHLLQFVVVNPKTKKVETELDDAVHQIKVLRPDSLSFQQINTAKSGEWKITKTYATDVERDSVLIDVQFETKNKSLNLYVYYDPSLSNSGMHDFASQQFGTDGDKVGMLLTQNSSPFVASVLAFSGELAEQTNGYYQVNDGLEQLKKYGKVNIQYTSAPNGNIVQMAKILNPSQFTTVLSFDKSSGIKAFVNTKIALQKGFTKIQSEYEKQWSDYIKTIPKVDSKYQAQFNMAAMILKAFEDKTNRGANIASLSIPWGGGANANEVGSSGYHAVWARDLYQVATAFMALGDKDAANRALDFLFKVQQKPDGSFPQNSWLDGKPIGGSLQMDQVGFPLILAHELGRFDREIYTKHIKPAADFIVKNGPTTHQERWEEKGGYSPSTIAAEIAGLVCAAEIAKKNNDLDSANRWLKTADEWQSNIEKWTVTTTGKHSKSPYYIRLTQNGKPDAGEKYEINGVYGMVDERDIVDAGFLELVRLGIKSPDNKIIQNSIKVVDQVINVKTPNGVGFYRYNFDSYGEPDNGQRWNYDGKWTGKGRLWALLSGERGQYELALSNEFTKIELTRSGRRVSAKIGKAIENPQSQNPNPQVRIDAMRGFANDGLMIPEQVWDSPKIPKNIDKQFVPELKFGEGTGSATPLAWSMAQFIRLAVNLKEGRNLDTPKVVYDRYVLGSKVGDLLLLQPSVTPARNERSDQAYITLDGVDINESETKGTIIQHPPRIDPNKIKEFRVTTKSQNPLEKFDECEKAKSYLFDDTRILQTIPQRTEKYPNVFGGKGEKETAIRFAYFGSETDIEIVGDFTGWKTCGIKFKKINGLPNINPLTVKFPNSARVEYKLIVDGKWITDPLNPNKVDNGIGGENSFFTMPDYKPTTWDKELTWEEQMKEAKGDISKVTLNGFSIEKISSNILGERDICVYIPEGFEKQKLPVLYLQDGNEYAERAKAEIILENLIKAKKVRPFILVLLNPKDRMKEYWANDDYAKFLAEEVVPVIDSKYNTIKSRDGRAVMGASLGAITAVNAALKYPNVFGRIGGQSTSFWIDNERVVKDLEKLESKTRFKFYFDDGTLEGVEDSRKVVKILQAKNFDVTYIESEAGHNWTAWRDRLADALIAIWR
ncbi:MAG TPA: glycoside hydrolase family 15 protein [Pyrinomonadaceae bacterium]|nr:glycoside hydrolase family 15 protein [Pyrinomonadaceae bacterium]